MIKENILRLKNDISLICQRLGRDSKDIAFVCVTKFATAPMIEEAINCGVTHIGENKVQEALTKFGSLKPRTQKITRHMIGHLQTNKVKEALKLFDLIQSLDSLKLVAAIDRAAGNLGRSADALLQVNISGEAQKHGVAPSEAMELLGEISRFPNLCVLGLMTVAPLTQDEKTIRDCFRGLRELRDQAEKKFAGAKNIRMDFLSMGMSSDYRIAIEEGANMVRIGSAIFKNV